MKPVLVALVVSLASVGAAAAADVAVPAAPAPSPPASYYPVLAPVNWGGLYLGVNGGYAFGRSTWTVPGASTGAFTTNGGLVGGTLGFNYAISGGLMVGVEGDLDWSALNGSSSVAGCASLFTSVTGFTPGSTCNTKSAWLSTARFRAGYAINRVLIFGTAGAAIGDFEVALNPPGGFVGIGPQLGWTAGGGIEFAFTDNVTAKIEYLYVDLGTISCPTGTHCAVTNAAGVTSGAASLTESLVRAGLNYKFTW